MYRLIEQEAVLQRRPLEFYPSKKKSVVDRTSQKSASIETGYLGPMSSTTDSIGTTVAVPLRIHALMRDASVANTSNCFFYIIDVLYG